MKFLVEYLQLICEMLHKKCFAANFEQILKIKLIINNLIAAVIALFWFYTLKNESNAKLSKTKEFNSEKSDETETMTNVNVFHNKLNTFFY